LSDSSEDYVLVWLGGNIADYRIVRYVLEGKRTQSFLAAAALRKLLSKKLISILL
jgi:hypothetical protein